MGRETDAVRSAEKANTEDDPLFVNFILLISVWNKTHSVCKQKTFLVNGSHHYHLAVLFFRVQSVL